MDVFRRCSPEGSVPVWRPPDQCKLTGCGAFRRSTRTRIIRPEACSHLFRSKFRWKLYLLKSHNNFHINGISSNCTWLDSSFKALSDVCWVQSDPSNCSAENAVRRKSTTRWLSLPYFVPVNYRPIFSRDFLGLKRQNVELAKGYRMMSNYMKSVRKHLSNWFISYRD